MALSTVSYQSSQSSHQRHSPSSFNLVDDVIDLIVFHSIASDSPLDTHHPSSNRSSTLAALSRISRQWRFPAQRLLFEAIDLDSEAGALLNTRESYHISSSIREGTKGKDSRSASKKLGLLVKVLEKNEELARSVRRVRFSGLRSGNVDTESVHGLTTLFRVAPRLEEVAFTWCHVRLQDLSCPQLRSLTFSECTIDHVPNLPPPHFRMLEKLSLYKTATLSRSTLPYLLSPTMMPSLKSLALLGYSPRWGLGATAFLFQMLQQLDHLTLDVEDCVDDILRAYQATSPDRSELGTTYCIELGSKAVGYELETIRSRRDLKILHTANFRVLPTEKDGGIFITAINNCASLLKSFLYLNSVVLPLQWTVGPQAPRYLEALVTDLSERKVAVRWEWMPYYDNGHSLAMA